MLRHRHLRILNILEMVYTVFELTVSFIGILLLYAGGMRPTSSTKHFSAFCANCTTLHRYQYTPAAEKSQRRAAFFRIFPNACQLRFNSFVHVVHSFLSKHTKHGGRPQHRQSAPAIPCKKGAPAGAPFARFQSIVQPCVPEDASAALLLAASPGVPVGFGWARYSSSVRPLAFIFCACSTPT